MFERVSISDIESWADGEELSRTKRELKLFDRAVRKAEPHHVIDDDIEELADTDRVLDRWFRRAVQLGDSVVYLRGLHALADPRAPRPDASQPQGHSSDWLEHLQSLPDLRT